eukprot:s1191_g19.t1
MFLAQTGSVQFAFTTSEVSQGELYHCSSCVNAEVRCVLTRHRMVLCPCAPAPALVTLEMHRNVSSELLSTMQMWCRYTVPAMPPSVWVFLDDPAATELR